jgi:predicted DNA-binding protein YlxM (UPF0122 family)
MDGMKIKFIDRLEDESPNPHEVAESSNFLNAVWENVPDERTRRILRMRFFEDMSYGEIAKRLKLTRQRIEQIEKATIKLLGSKLELDKHFGIRYRGTRKYARRQESAPCLDAKQAVVGESELPSPNNGMLTSEQLPQGGGSLSGNGGSEG